MSERLQEEKKGGKTHLISLAPCEIISMLMLPSARVLYKSELISFLDTDRELYEKSLPKHFTSGTDHVLHMFTDQRQDSHIL